jgi:hypothetical protein
VKLANDVVACAEEQQRHSEVVARVEYFKPLQIEFISAGHARRQREG